MLESLDSIEWGALPQPPSNRVGELSAALRALAAVGSVEEAERVYHQVLYALGNNHAGTYYPVVLAAVPFLGELLQHGSNLARQTTLDILVDLTGSFEPEPGFETVVDQTGRSVRLDRAMYQAVGDLGREIRTCAAAEAPDRQRSLARELISQLIEKGVGGSAAEQVFDGPEGMVERDPSSGSQRYGGPRWPIGLLLGIASVQLLAATWKGIRVMMGYESPSVALPLLALWAALAHWGVLAARWLAAGRESGRYLAIGLLLLLSLHSAWRASRSLPPTTARAQSRVVGGGLSLVVFAGTAVVLWRSRNQSGVATRRTRE